MRPLALLATLLLLASCTGRTSYGVEIGNERPFTPSHLSVTPGTTVVFKNSSTTPQTVTADPQVKKAGPFVQLPAGAAALESGTLYPGETYSYTFETPGTYIYVSRYAANRYRNLQDNTSVGVVHVTEAGSAP